MVNQNHHALPFVQLDVFTSVPLEGNQLAVFTDARGLSDAQMQSLAREMNLAETTFIVPRDAATQQERGVRVRIFTVSEELSFAGHPTLGTALVLRGSGNAESVSLDLNVGKIPVRFSDRNGLPFGEMTQRDPEFGTIHSREDVARVTDLALDDIAGDVPIQNVSTGYAFAIVPVRSRAVLEKLNPVWSRMSDYLKRTDTKFFYFVSREPSNPSARLQARMFFYYGEDPATGGAAGPCIAWALQYGLIAPEELALIEQGVEMKRKSQLFVRASKEGNKIVNVRVGGHAVKVAQGEVML